MTTNTTINDLLIMISKGEKYDEMISNIMKCDYYLKNELISEISFHWLNKPEKPVKAYELGYFDYYFLRTVLNQYNSNRSSFHINNRLYDNYSNMYDNLEEIVADETTDIELKMEVEKRLDIIKNGLNKCGASWFNVQMFKEYYFEDRTYRDIQSEYDIDHVVIWKAVKDTREKLDIYLKTKK